MTFQAQIKAIEQRLSTLQECSVGSSTRRHLPEKNTIPRTFSGELDQWRDDVADFLDTRNVGMFKFLHAIAMNRDTLVDSTMKRKWAALGEKVSGDHVQVWRARKGLTGGFARSVAMIVLKLCVS